MIRHQGKPRQASVWHGPVTSTGRGLWEGGAAQGGGASQEP